MQMSGTDTEVSVVVDGERRMAKVSQIEGLMNTGKLCIGCGHRMDQLGSGCLERIKESGFQGCWYPEGTILVK